MHKPRSHFNNKGVLGHLRETRIRGQKASQEDHGTESPGYFSAAIDSAKETAALFVILVMIFYLFKIISNYPDDPLFFQLFGALSIAWILWKVARSALLGWNRLSKLHRLMHEEKHEIETNPEEEREELKAIYQEKGFEGDLLERVIDVLMSDDHKALIVMLEEEFGIGLENCDHPLKQGVGAAVGSFLSISALLAGHLIFPIWGVVVASFVVTAITAYMIAKADRQNPLSTVIWHTGVLFLVAFSAYFFAAFIEGY